MRALVLFLLLTTTGCYHGGYAGHHHNGWHSQGTHEHHTTIEHPTHDAPPALTTLEGVRKGRLEGEEKVRRAFAPPSRR